MNTSYLNTNSEPLNNKEIPMIDVQQPLNYEDSYYGDEYYESSMYSNQSQVGSGLTPSPKKSKRLPSTATSNSTSYKTPTSTTPSIINVAGAGLSTLFNSISNTLHSPAVTTSSSLFSPSVPASSSIFSSTYSTSDYTSSAFTSSAYTMPAFTTSAYTSSAYTSSAYAPTAYTSYGSTSFNSATGKNFNLASSLIPNYSASFTTPSFTTSSFAGLTTSYTAAVTTFSPSITSYAPISSYTPITSYSALSSYDSVLDKTYSSAYSLSSIYDKESQSVNVSAPSSKLFNPLSTLTSIFSADPVTTTSAPTSTLYSMSTFYDTNSSTYTSSSIYNLTTSGYETTSSSYQPTMTSSYNATMSLGILGHSPILEEEGENEIMLDDSYPETSTYTPMTSSMDIYKVGLTSMSLDTVNTIPSYTSDALNVITSSYMPTISDPYFRRLSYVEVLEDKIEEYREDYEEGVLPPTTTFVETEFITKPATSTVASTTATTTASSYPITVDDYYYENSTYPLNSKLSTIPETAHDVYLSNNDLQAGADIYEEQLTTPGAYDYTENENDYIASGDLKNTNLYQTNYTSASYQPMTTASTLPSSSSASISNTHQSQPEQKKSRFGLGSLFSDGLNVIGSSVNTIKSTATNLAGGAVGVVGGVVGAAAAAAQSTQSVNQNLNQNHINNQINVENTTSGTSITTNQTSFTSQPQPSMKLKKQEYAIFDEENNDDVDPYGAKQVTV